MEKMINHVKNVLKKGVIEFFGNKLKEMIPKEFRSLMNINVVVHKGKSPIGRILKEQLKIALKILGNLIKILINVLLNILKAITTSNNPSDILKKIFEDAKNSSINVLKSGLKENLRSLLFGSLSEIKNLIEGKCGKKGVISSWTDYFIQEVKITEKKANELTNILASNGILSLDGELNLNEISENQNQKSNFKIKLNITNNSLFREISKPIIDVPKNKVKKLINDISNDISYRIEKEIESIISYSNEFVSEGIQLLTDNKEEVKNEIQNMINTPKDEIINHSINILNNIKKSFINDLNKEKDFIKKEFEKLEKTFINAEDENNNILNKFEKSKISNKYFGIIKDINKRIDINKITNIKNFLSKFNEIINKILENYIPKLQLINIFLDSSKLDTFIEKTESILYNLGNFIEDEINPLIDFIVEQKKLLNGESLKDYICDIKKITFDSEKINDSIENMKNKYIDINDNIKNEIKIKIDELIEQIFDLDDKINEKINDILENLVTPYDKIQELLEDILYQIEEKVNNIKSRILDKLDKLTEEINIFAEKFMDESLNELNNIGNNLVSNAANKSNFCSEAIKKGNNFIKNAEQYLNKIVEKPAEFIKKLESLNNEMKEYEKSSNMDETINLLNDTIIDSLIDILTQALQNSEIGNFIKNASNKVLKAMESTKKDLKSDLEGIGQIPVKKNYLPLPKINKVNKNNKDKDKIFKSPKTNTFEKFKTKIKLLKNFIQKVISKDLKKNFEFPKEFKSVTYINFKFAESPFKKIILKQLEISLKTLKDILPLLNNFIKAVISSIKGGKDMFNDISNSFNDFSNGSYSKLQDGFTDSIKNIKIGLLSLIKDIFLGKSKFNNSLAILTWSDYFIKGIKICSDVSEAETLSQALIENNIISIDGELNKKNILELNELRQIKIKNFPIYLKMDLNEKYNNVKNKIGQKINNIYDFNPKEKILSLMKKKKKKIENKIKDNLKIIEDNCLGIFNKGIEFILYKENEFKKLIKNKINNFIQQILKELIDILNNFKNTINNISNKGLDYIHDSYGSIWNNLNTIEENINKNFQSIIIKIIKEVFGNIDIMENLKRKLNLEYIIKYIYEEASLKIFNSLLKVINPYIDQINKVITIINIDFKEVDGKKLKENIINMFNSFLYKFKNEIKPFIDYVRNIKIRYNEIEINKFILKNIYIPINSLSIMNEIKEQKVKLDEFLIDIENNKNEILDSIEYLINYLYGIYDLIDQKEDIILDNLLKPCDNLIYNLNSISDEIKNKINNLIFPTISSIIRDYIEKIETNCLKIISKFIDKIDNINHNIINKFDNTKEQLMKYGQKGINMCEKGYSKIKNALDKINFKKAENLFNDFKSLCMDIKNYDEKEVNMEIINDLCDGILKEIEKMIKDCIEESELSQLFNMDNNCLIEKLGLNS